MSLLFFVLIFFFKLFTTYACTPKLSIRHQPNYRRKRVTWSLLQEGFQEKLSWVGSLGHSFLPQMLRGSLFLSHNYGIEKQWLSAHSHSWSLSHQKRMPVWCVIAYNFCWSHLRFYPSKIPGLPAPVLVFLSLKLPSNSMPNLITPSGNPSTLQGARAVSHPKRKSAEWVIRTLGFKS